MFKRKTLKNPKRAKARIVHAAFGIWPKQAIRLRLSVFGRPRIGLLPVELGEHIFHNEFTGIDLAAGTMVIDNKTTTQKAFAVANK
jgi:hypothetical protein